MPMIYLQFFIYVVADIEGICDTCINSFYRKLENLKQLNRGGMRSVSTTPRYLCPWTFYLVDDLSGGFEEGQGAGGF